MTTRIPTPDELLSEFRPYHSKHQMRHHITARSGLTLFGQWTQALRELDSRTSTLREAYAEHELARIDLDELEERVQMGEYDSPYEARRDRVRLARMRLEMPQRERNVRDLEREFLEFYAQAIALRSALGDLTEERREELDRQTWAWKLRRRIGVEMLTGGVTSGTYDHVDSAPPKVRQELLEALRSNPGAILDDFQHVAPYQLTLAEHFPGPEALPKLEEVRALVEAAG